LSIASEVPKGCPSPACFTTARDLVAPLIRPNLGLFRAGETALSLVLAFTRIHWWIKNQFWGIEDRYHPETLRMVTALPPSPAFAVGRLVSVWITGPEPAPAVRAPPWDSGELASKLS
jgi:hypothetical protein